MNDKRIRELQRQNELRAFFRYQEQLNDAYARSQDPHPPRWMRPSADR